MVGEPARRVLVVFETHWDRKQLAACRDAWSGRVEIVYPPPDDVACPHDFDVLGFVDAVVSGGHGVVDGVLSSSDYPGATVAAAIATRLGLPGSRPEAGGGASHKYYSRVAQQRVAPEAVPRFAIVDPEKPEVLPQLPFPFFVKPVKGAYSVLARRVDDAEALRAFLTAPALREFTSSYLAIFNQLVRACSSFELDGRYLIAEELLRGQLVTVEGFVCEGEVELLGIVDSSLYPGGSFERFDYPSRLPAPVQARMADVTRRVVRELGLERSLFNIEMTWDPERDRIAIVEVNPRICGQFADLYQKVDGTHGYEVALALCLGRRPRVRRGEGPFRAAASFPLRVFQELRVLRAPGAEDVAAVERRFPGVLVWNECAAGEDLSDFGVDEDGVSHRYAVVNLGGESREELAVRCEEVRRSLAYAMAPLGR